MNVFEPIIVKFTDETTGPDGTTTTRGGGGVTGSLAGMAGSLTAVVGVVSELLGVVKAAVDSVLKPLRTMLTAVMRVLAQLLRPIVDVMVLMLQPILHFLKPIIQVANEVMRPFRTLAYGLMREATLTDDTVQSNILSQMAISTMFAGISNVILAMAGELIKFVTTTVIDLFGGVLRFFGVETDVLKNTINSNIDNALTGIQSWTLQGIMTLATNVVRGGEDEILRMNALFQRTVSSASEDVANALISDENSVVNRLQRTAELIENSRTSFDSSLTNTATVFSEGLTNINANVDSSFNDLSSSASQGFNNLSGSISDSMRRMFDDLEGEVQGRGRFGGRSVTDMLGAGSNFNLLSLSMPSLLVRTWNTVNDKFNISNKLNGDYQ